MKKIKESLQLSATDLVGHLNCRHLTGLDRAVAEGTIAKPKVWDPLLKILWERGIIHEKNYVAHLEKAGFHIVKIDGVDITEDAVSQTIDVMKDGAQVIVQGSFINSGWVGRTDILRRVEVPSDLGSWSYEVIDTKLARETKGGTILQLCLYSDLLAQAQGFVPEFMYIVSPWSDFEPAQYRVVDYAAYYRRVKAGLEQSLALQENKDTYPDPKDHCDVCRWHRQCDSRRHEDDHLCLVAGISKAQINELKQHVITTTSSLADLELPIPWKPERGSEHSYARIKEQARIQVEARESGKRKFELLPIQAGFGLACLPKPSDGDIFLDLEGDPFVGEHGLEYLFGYQFKNESDELTYTGDWALSREEEKRSFEVFVDFVMKRWSRYPDLHIYHYAPYETGALKRLMGRYATCEEEIDQMLRAKLFVDLYSVVRHSIRASVESYSLKKLEPFYGYERQTDLPEANQALAQLQASLELNDVNAITEANKAIVESYNRDDCSSTNGLRDWLEGQRVKLITEGAEIARPEPGDGAPNETISEWLEKIGALIEKLINDIPTDPEDHSKEQHGRWILANILDFHRREQKAIWWEYFRLADLSAEDLLEERPSIAGLTFIGEAGGTARAPIHRYKFPPQETELRGDEPLMNIGGDKLGTLNAISFEDLTVDIKKRQDSVRIHPEAMFAHKVIDNKVLADSLVLIGEYVADNGLIGNGAYQAARDLLMKQAPRISGVPIRFDEEKALDAALRIAPKFEGGVIPIQGPPGSGKTFTGGRMICELVRHGKKVGVTANSHKVIRNLLDSCIEAAEERGVDVQCVQKPESRNTEEDIHRLSFVRNNDRLFTALRGNCQVAGGTAWLWSRPEALNSVDVLFVDEAAQMSLANVLAVSQAAQTIVLLGDPQQLDQPMQGSHPEGTDASVLTHILDGKHTISADKGLFLEETWRLHPDICAFTSELFYDGKLHSKDELEVQIIKSGGAVQGSGLRYISVDHSGNQNCSPEEADVIRDLVNNILHNKSTWVDRYGSENSITIEDIMIISPYNAQVFEIKQRLPGARVGTVDKFQGQEAPVAIYSTATSSHADAPRGMEFLYSLNRLNVATSRARCISIIVGSPQIFEAECRTPRHIQLANAFCRYLEMAHHLSIKSL